MSRNLPKGPAGSGYALEAGFRHTTVGDVGSLILRTAGIAISAAFLIGALLFVAVDRPANKGPDAFCAAPAKGGALCIAPHSIDDHSIAGAVKQEDCASLGKGGRICPEPLQFDSR
jgi:hypothetical protein